MKKAGIVLLALLTAVSFCFANGQGEDGKLLTGNVRVVIGSTSTGGDTYQNSSIVAAELEKQLGVNMKVDAVGASAAFDALKRSSDGHTIMIFHDMAYLGYLYGREGYSNILEDYTVGPLLVINPGNAFLAPKNSPYNTIEDVIAACGSGKDVKVAIQPGGVSEIGYSAIKNAIKVQYPGMESHLVAVNTGSQSNKDQLLFDGQVDIIHGAVQSNEQYTRLPADDQKAMKFLWLTARKETIEGANANGFGETDRTALLKYVEPNVVVTQDGTKNFTFDKDFFVLYNKDMSPELVKYFDAALTAIYNRGEIQQTQKKSFFIPHYMPSAEAKEYVADKMAAYRKIIDAIR